MSTFKFSVLMSVYKNEIPEYFELALKSNYEAQTLKPDEIVLVCDGPLTDALNTVIDKYENAYKGIFKVYRIEKNCGLGKALSFGLEKCSFEWIARSDSDDICDSRRFEKQFEYIRNHPDTDILGSYIDEFNKDHLVPVHRKEMPLKHEDIVEMAKFRNPINHMTVVFRKRLIEEIGSYQHLPYVEDYYLWVRAIVNGAKLANYPDYLVHARIGNGMVERRGNKAYIGSWKKLNDYMLGEKMIGKATHLKNMMAVRAFVYMPSGLKKVLYKVVLRK